LRFAGIAGGFAILREREFTRYVGARFFSSIAAQMLIVAVGWQVYRLTGRVLDLGFIGLSQFLPFLGLSLLAGHAADRHDRGRIVGFCLATFLLSALLLLALGLARVKNTLPIFAVLGLLGVARAFLAPASQSFVANLVPRESLASALALSASSWQVATIAGPSLGGIVYAFGETSGGIERGAIWVYGTAAGLLALAVALVATLKRRPGRPVRASISWFSLLEGLRFVWRRKTVLGAISLDLFAVLFGGATALLPAFTRDVLHAGPAVFGSLRAAPGVGAGLCALWLAFRPVKRRVGVVMFCGVALFGAATLVFGSTRHFWVALVSLALLGAGDMVSVFIRQLLVQLETPDEIRGRVSAVNSVFIGASNELGEFESGFTAAWFGLVPAIVLGGVVTLLVVMLWAGVFFPNLRRLDTFDQLKDNAANGN
jgi:MFS family permease